MGKTSKEDIIKLKEDLSDLGLGADIKMELVGEATSLFKEEMRKEILFWKHRHNPRVSVESAEITYINWKSRANAFDVNIVLTNGYSIILNSHIVIGNIRIDDRDKEYYEIFFKSNGTFNLHIQKLDEPMTFVPFVNHKILDSNDSVFYSDKNTGNSGEHFFMTLLNMGHTPPGAMLHMYDIFFDENGERIRKLYKKDEKKKPDLDSMSSLIDDDDELPF